MVCSIGATAESSLALTAAGCACRRWQMTGHSVQASMAQIPPPDRSPRRSLAAWCRWIWSGLRCHREGHQTRTCKRRCSPDTARPLPWQPCLSSVIVINPGKGNVALAEHRDRFGRPRSSTPPGLDRLPMPEGSPSCHVLPSPPSPPPLSLSPPTSPTGGQLSVPERRHLFETWVISRTSEINQVEKELANALVAVVSRVQPSV
jgi:hypothetical protein